MTFRPLNDNEISILTNQGCQCENWKQVSVHEPFLPERVLNVRFSGEVKIGNMDSTISLPGGIQKSCGLYNSHLHNCTIADHVYIADVNTLANYDVETGAILESIGSLLVEGETAFGNGTAIEVLNEGGGRPLILFDRLSSQIAYFLVLYRHKSAMIKKLEEIIAAYVKTKFSSKGKIGEHSLISNCATLKNIHVGPYTTIQGAALLENGTLASGKTDPIYIGHGVYAKDFIVASGSKIDGAAMLTACFVGQGVKIGRQYSAENSAFFANCEGFHGEACSVFSGPYTVTHHKSTLLIGGLFSFYNAGSGTNQSNHMYKLGPVHQGVLERGSKTGSFSYLLWPCRVGAFTAVIGKHYENFDTSDFPFSYINEVNGKSMLTPAMNLFTVGTRRDSAKWPARDRRKDPNKLDWIHFDLFSPYTVGRMVRGIETLQTLYENASKKQDYVTHKGITIKRLLLKTCSKYYEMGVKIFIGDCLLDQLKQCMGNESLEELTGKLTAGNTGNCQTWLDICGLLVPAQTIDSLLEEIEKGTYGSIDDINNQLKKLYENYEPSKWSWCVGLIEKRCGMKMNQLPAEQLVQMIMDGKTTRVKLNNMIINDAIKEFDEGAQIGFGIDGDDEIRKRDFEAVRGTVDTNSFIRELRDENQRIEQFMEQIGWKKEPVSENADSRTVLQTIIKVIKSQ
ncbi:MAG: DUF4954 family protein [Candidatus Omnitrophota bacterium]|jgi:hypothetical protein|nr:MAG: DUF4954 family protein [Candidatus Omnitrophota bacterium]